MDKFFVPRYALDDAQRAIVSKFHTSPMLEMADVLRLGLGYYEEENLNQQDAGDLHNYPPIIVKRHVRSILWFLLPFLRQQASYAGLGIPEDTDWSQWVASYDPRRMGMWFYMPEMPDAQLEAIEIFESFGEFPT